MRRPWPRPLRAGQSPAAASDDGSRGCRSLLGKKRRAAPSPGAHGSGREDRPRRRRLWRRRRRRGVARGGWRGGSAAAAAAPAAVSRGGRGPAAARARRGGGGGCPRGVPFKHDQRGLGIFAAPGPSRPGGGASSPILRPPLPARSRGRGCGRRGRPGRLGRAAGGPATELLPGVGGHRRPGTHSCHLCREIGWERGAQPRPPRRPLQLSEHVRGEPPPERRRPPSLGGDTHIPANGGAEPRGHHGSSSTERWLRGFLRQVSHRPRGGLGRGPERAQRAAAFQRPGASGLSFDLSLGKENRMAL